MCVCSTTYAQREAALPKYRDGEANMPIDHSVLAKRVHKYFQRLSVLLHSIRPRVFSKHFFKLF
jgi:hypothetical protein